MDGRRSGSCSNSWRRSADDCPAHRAPGHRVVGWDPTVLARIRHLHLRARVLTDSLLMGEHRSRRVGQAVEFADYQEYQPGLDLRFLDWKVLARSDRLVVKRFETETELPCTVVLDLSADLATGRTGKGGYPDLDASKAGFALTLAATILFFLHRHGEPIGLEIVAGEGTEFQSLPPRTGKNHLQRCFLRWLRRSLVGGPIWPRRSSRWAVACDDAAGWA